MKNAEIKYVILSGTRDGQDVIGMAWDSNGKEVVVLDKESKIDLDFALEVHDVENNDVMTGVMWMDIITDQLEKINKKNEQKKSMKHVAIFGMNRDKSSDKYHELRKQFLPEIKKENSKYHTSSFETEELSVEESTYSDSYRGKRFDEIYVDSDLSIKDLENIKLMKKSEQSRIIFY